MPEALLPERDMRQIQTPIPPGRFVQQVYRVGEIRGGAVCHICQEMPPGQMYGYQFRRQHPPAGVPQPTHTHTQGVQGVSTAWQMLVGLVLRLQTAPDMQ